MSFSYGGGSNPPIDYPRLLTSDTVAFDASGNRVYAFEDSEILAAAAIEGAVWQSSQFYSGQAGRATLPTNPQPWRRIAATLLDALAANQARLTIISQILDVKLTNQAAQEMRAQAQALRDADDNSGAFFIAEQVNNYFSFRDRYWKSVQRQSGGGVAI